MTSRDDHSAEDAAYRLFRHIAAVERKALDREEIRQGGAPASRQWILDTYSECLHRVTAAQRREAPIGNLGAAAIEAATPLPPTAPATREPVMPGPDASPDQPLDKWIPAHCESDAYKARVKAVREAAGDGLLSPESEVALICELIEHLRPALAIEIGTFFGQTARPMAEALSRHNGKLITIDPYGGHRMPGIIADWPEPLRIATDFRPIFSMELFARMEERETVDNTRPTIGVAFIDGNHKFEYAFFDMMEAAQLLSPGGAIVADNMELEGPRLAVLQFLRMNPAWKLYYLGKIWNAPISARDLRPPKNVASEWGVLMAPTHLQVAMKGRTFRGKLLQLEVITGVRLNLCAAPSEPVEMRVNLLYSAWPLDYHLTGTGVVGLRREAAVVIRPGMDAVDITFDAPGRLPPHDPPVNLTYQIETTLLDETAYVLLDAQRPFEFKFAPQGE